MPPLRQGEFLTKNEDGVVSADEDYFEKWGDLGVDTWTDANMFIAPEGKFLVADSLFSFIATRPEWLQEQLSYQTYLLPSQQLGLFMKWFDLLASDEDKKKIVERGWTTISWGQPVAYKIDLSDFPRVGKDVAS